NAPRLLQKLTDSVTKAFLQQAPLMDAALQSLSDDGRLLHNLFQHEMPVWPLVRYRAGDQRPANRTVHPSPLRIEDFDFIEPDCGDIPILQKNEILRDVKQRGYIGSYEVFGFAGSYDEWTSKARRYDEIGIVRADNRQGIG